MPAPPPTTAIASTTTTTTAASGHARKPDQHKHRRRFIGPVPEKVLLQKVAEPTHQRRRSWFSGWQSRTFANGKQEDDILQDVVREHALDYFLGHGGKIQDWNEEEDRRVREIMLKRWKESEWGQARKTVQWDTTTAKKWIGSSFDVGVFLGVNLLDETASRSLHNSGMDASTSTSRIRSDRATTPGTSFVTARSEFTDSSTQNGDGIPPTFQQLGTNSNGPSSLQPELLPKQNDHSSSSAGSADSTTALIVPRPLAANEVVSPSQRDTNPTATILKMPSQAQNSSSLKTSKQKAKAVRVHYADMAGDETPAPPREVLARRGSELPNTSAAAARQATVENQTPWGEVIMRGTEVCCFCLF